jgi:trafficking kinesin-binding protein 1
VHIGKELLSQNTQLEKKILELEAELRHSNENVAQLRHELHKKTELINVLTDNEDSMVELGKENTILTLDVHHTKISILDYSNNAQQQDFINFDILQRKISALETDKKTLTSAVTQVIAVTDEMEERERRLIQDLNQQLNSSHMENENVHYELERYKEENRLQSEQIDNLMQRLSETELRLHQLLSENEDAYMTLNVTKENQSLLATELSEFKSRYQETLTLLQETQLLLREKQRKSQPQSNRSSLYVPGMTASVYNPESLHTELMESSLFSEISSLDSGINSDHGHQKSVPQFQKVFNTVKCAANAQKNGISDSLASELNMISSHPRMSCSIYSSDCGLKPSDKETSSFSIYSSIYGSQKSGDDANSGTESDDYNSHRQYGMMGCPGAKDLETALKNLNSAEIISRRAKLSHESYSYEHSEMAHTPESMFSSVSTSAASSLGSSLSRYRYPKKLEIVKPLEVIVHCTLNCSDKKIYNFVSSCLICRDRSH